MTINKRFLDLTKEEKIEFFLHGQNLLLQYHTHSPFLFRRNNVQERLNYVREVLEKYKGYCYMDDFIIVLFNHVVVEDPKNVIETLKKYQFNPPDPNFNALSVDFVIFRSMTDCMNWCKSKYDPKIKYVVYVKNGKPQIFKTEKLISRLFHVPLAVG